MYVCMYVCIYMDVDTRWKESVGKEFYRFNEHMRGVCMYTYIHTYTHTHRDLDTRWKESVGKEFNRFNEQMRGIFEHPDWVKVSRSCSEKTKFSSVKAAEVRIAGFDVT